MVRLLLSRIRPDLVTGDNAAPDVDGVEQVVLPVELVVRESA